MERFRRFLSRHPRAYRVWFAVLSWLGHRRIPLLRAKLNTLWGMISIQGCLSIVNPGDIIAVRSYRFLTSYLIPGRYSHSVVYTGGGFVIHAVSPRVCEEKLERFLLEYDGFILLRPRGIYDWKKADREAFLNLKIGYDFSFAPDNKESYCHELSAKVIEKGTGRKVPIKGDRYTWNDIAAVCDVVMEV